MGLFDNPREYERSAARQLDGLRALNVLSPTTRVLDVGCGTGRIASALTTYLDSRARYEGLDPQPVPVRWCREHISPLFPNFHFHETGTASPKYNPTGLGRADEYRFPFPDSQFDLILLLSVLTHVSRPVEERLLAECRRVLATGGHVVLTEYLLDEMTRPVAESGRTRPEFAYRLGSDRTQTPDTPEGFVARDASWARALWSRVALDPVNFLPGTWAGRAGADSFTFQYVFFQDVVVLAGTGEGGS